MTNKFELNDVPKLKEDYEAQVKFLKKEFSEVKDNYNVPKHLLSNIYVNLPKDEAERLAKDASKIVEANTLATKELKAKKTAVEPEVEDVEEAETSVETE